MNEFVTGGLWEPEKIKWDHHKIESYIENNWKEESDEELAESLSEMTGKNVTRAKVKEKRLDMGINRSDYVQKHIDRSNCGVEGQVDWNDPEVIKYIQVRYKDQSDLEIARGLSERFDADVSWEAARRHRLDMGYKKDVGSKDSEFDIKKTKYRKFIYDNHPDFQGDGQINEFLVDFYEKFDPPITLKSLKRRVINFIKEDGYLRSMMKEIKKSDIDFYKINRWINLP